MQCAEHHAYFGAWQCHACDALKCDLCVRALPSALGARGSLRVCGKCGEVVREAPRVLLDGRAEGIDLVRRPMSREGLTMCAMLALPLALTDVPLKGVPLLCGAAWAAATTAYVFQTVDHVGRDQPGLPFSAQEVSSRSDVARWLLRGALCGLVGFGPAALVIVTVKGTVTTTAFAALVALGALTGMFCMPAAILAVVFTSHTLNAVWPLAWASIIARSPARYARLVGVYAAVGLAGAILVTPVAALLWRIPFAGKLVVGGLAHAVLLAQAALLGGYVRRHAEEYDYDDLAPR